MSADMSKLRIGLFGANGRMGQEITALIKSSEDFELVSAPQKNEFPTDEKAKSVEVWIDFTTAESFSKILDYVKGTGKPFISGTTGFNVNGFEQIMETGKSIPILWSSNMSMGVAVLNEALKSFAAISDFDYQIEEIHHNRKKDAPSGTAITLKNNLEEALSKKIQSTVSIRGGGVFGIHKIFAMSEEEMLVFEHSALNRAVFAKGALKAAAWIAHKSPGVYVMRDVLFGSKK